MSIRSTAQALLLAVMALFAQRVEAQPPETDAVRFTISPKSDRDAVGARLFLATYGSGDQQAQFVIELDEARTPAQNVDPELNIAFSTGRFRHVAGSKPDALLAHLATALEAKAPTRSPEKRSVLPFQIVFIGAPSSRAAGGGFGAQSGDWFTTKLFLADGEGEVYFNFKPVAGEAEFSIKDSDYGDIVVTELSKILW